MRRGCGGINLDLEGAEGQHQEMNATMLGWQQRLKRLKQLKGYECKLLIVDKEY
jgi:hypothetical protein